MKNFVATFALGFALVATAAAHADTFAFNASGAGFEASGSIAATADATQPGVYDITSISGEVNGVGMNGLLAGSYNNSAPTTNTNGVFIFDNLLYSASPSVDYNGLGFNIGGSGEQGNIFSSAGSYYFLDSSGAQTQLNSFDVAPTPEPSTFILLGTGLVGAAGAVRRRLKV